MLFGNCKTLGRNGFYAVKSPFFEAARQTKSWRLGCLRSAMQSFGSEHVALHGGNALSEGDCGAGSVRNQTPRKNSQIGVLTTLAIRSKASMEMIFSPRSISPRYFGFKSAISANLSCV